MNSTTPVRIEACTALATNIMLCAKFIEDYRNSPEEVNSVLAFCELAVSLPPEWFTEVERRCIVSLIKTLWGDPREFIKMLDEGQLAFYDKMRPEGSMNLIETVAVMFKRHQSQFHAQT